MTGLPIENGASVANHCQIEKNNLVRLLPRCSGVVILWCKSIDSESTRFSMLAFGRILLKKSNFFSICGRV